MSRAAALTALLVLGWPALCLAEPLKAIDGLVSMFFRIVGVGLALGCLPVAVLLVLYWVRWQPSPSAQERWPDLPAERCALLQEACQSRGLHLRALVSGPQGLSLTVAAGTQLFELKATAPHGLGGEALQDALVQSALGRLDALRALLGAGASS